MLRSRFRFSLLLLAGIAWALPARSAPVPVRIVKKGDGFQLTRNGQPFFIKGAGGDGSKQLLHDIGGNSWRTWGADNLGPQLDAAQQLGMAVTVGIWLGHKDNGFDYGNAQQVTDQYEHARQAILKYKDHPALLMWGIGNEMESGQEDNAAMWKAVNDIAALAKKLDPNHPTMTVVAEIGGNKVKNINQYCPDIDIIGINSYGGAASLAKRYVAAGGVKPYVVTEYGPAGIWEVGKNNWGTADEPTSTEKGEIYRRDYQQAIAGSPLCLGSYAFTWGNKQEATATWFGMLLPDGSRLAPVDTMQELWTGKPPAHKVPVLNSLKIQGADQVDPGATVQVKLDVSDPENDPLKVQWVLQAETKAYGTGGSAEAVLPTFPAAIVQADNKHAELKMPAFGGGYRLFAYVHDNYGGAAVANVPLFVTGNKPGPRPTAPMAQLPLTVYGETGPASPYIPSGYMGNTAAIKMDADSTTNPHSGKTCLRVDYTATDNWGGVVWQNPDNNWGAKPGGLNLTGATKLSFWARGEKGGEKVSFSFGIVGRDQPFYDSATGKLADVQLTTDWQQYSIDLQGKDLSRIISGFVWTVAGSGQPITFYLDDIRYEGTSSAAAPGSAANTTPAAKTAQLPFAVYAEAGQPEPYAPSGYMGNTTAIKMDEKSTNKPHAGQTCLRVDYTATDNWGGVVWQNPDNNWGTKPGGYDLTGAKKLTFWARGEKGGEKVSFSFGVVDRDKAVFDTATGKLADVQLTTDWKQYSIDLTDKDLTRIISGFVWTVAANGQPITFYLDDIRYE